MHQRAAYDVHGRPASLLLWGILARVSTSRRASSSPGLSLSLAFSRDRTPAGVGLGRCRVVSTRVASPRIPPPPPTKTDSADKPTTRSTFTSVLLMYYRNSAIPPASPLIRKSTTLRSTLWCSHYSVAVSYTHLTLPTNREV